MKLKISHDYPPNYLDIVRVFPAVKNRKSVLFTFGNVVYVPGDKGSIPDHLKVHEETHVKQQGDNPGEWWDKYLKDEEFRLNQEVEAYQNQFKFFCKKDRSIKHQETFLNKIARDLSGSIYGEIVDFETAKHIIRGRGVEGA